MYGSFAMMVTGTNCDGSNGRFGYKARTDDERPLRRGEQGVAVRLGAGDIFGAEVLRRAGAVLDHDGLAELGGQMLAEDARHQIAVRAGRQRDDDADGLARIGLRRCNACTREQHNRERDRWAAAVLTGICGSSRVFCANVSWSFVCAFSQRSAAPVVCKARGAPSFPFPRKVRGAERRAAPCLKSTPCGGGVRKSAGRAPLVAPRGDFVRGRSFRTDLGPRLPPGAILAPVVQQAPCTPVVVPVGRGPEASREPCLRGTAAGAASGPAETTPHDSALGWTERAGE